MSAFPIDLIFPPQAHPTQPYLALPCIKAWLEDKGYTNVRLTDVGVQAYNHFLSGDYLRWAIRRTEARHDLAGYADKTELSFAELDAFRAAAEVAASANTLADRIDGAKDIMRSEAFYDPAAYIPAARTVFHALRLVSAAWAPSRLTAHNFTMRYSIERSSEVLAATFDEDENPFLDFFRKQVLPDLIERQPRLVGLSVIYGSQLIPALTLGRLIKAALPDCHVTAGGGFLAYIGEKLINAPALSECLDSIVFYEGEKPMEELARALEAGSALKDVASIGYFDHSGDAVVGRMNPAGHPVALDKAPTPNFDGLDFAAYFSPDVVIPFDVNRGCYYGECSFCTLPTVIGPGYSTRQADTIVRQVKELKAKYGRSVLNFITDCLPPGMIRELPEALIREEANIKWWCDARVEPKAYTKEGAETLYAAGCRKLLFGFETAVPRLLKLMKKGQSPARTLEVANNCNDAGISVTFYAMVGFPSETREEARETMRLITEHGAKNGGPIREVSLQTFHVDEVAEVFRDPTTYGINVIHDATADLALYHDFEANSGMSQLEAAEMFDEMMAGLREALPLFEGDAFFYFMQKSHYFLHLAHDTSPDAFIELCRAAGLAAEGGPRAQTARLAAHPGLVLVPLPFSYKETVARLAHPLAKAARPDFLTGTYQPHLEAQAARTLGALPAQACVLAYAPGATEFIELSPDSARLLQALIDAGDAETLLTQLGAQSGANRDKLEAWLQSLSELGLALEMANA